jgi:hypothetical protein
MSGMYVPVNMLRKHNRRLLSRCGSHNRLEDPPVLDCVSGIGCDCPRPVFVSRVDVFVCDARAGFALDGPVAAVPAYDAAVESDLSIRW